MKSCSYCGRENADEAVYCSECGTEFEPATEPANPEASASESDPSGYVIAPLSEEDKQKGLVTVIKCGTLVEADCLAARLRAAGIDVFIPDEMLMQAIGWNLNTYGYVRVQVAPKDYEAARDLLSWEEEAADEAV